ncbi:MAG: DUF4339 domain-containing protein [Kiritimatiellae bacterium]|nr:DUF4339 domain-containing protein [Kiritimatiellia bacterium]
MGKMPEEWYVRSPDGQVYGPTDRSTLIDWAGEGRVEPGGFVSRDRRQWIPAQLMEELEMEWVVEAEPGKFFGPFNRRLVVKLASSGELPEGAAVYRRHKFAVDKDPPPKIVEKIVEKVVIKEVPVEKIVEKIIEVEPPPRSMIVDPGGVVAAPRPPAPPSGGIFKNVDPARLAALEAAARRELAAAEASGFGGFFSRRKG